MTDFRSALGNGFVRALKLATVLLALFSLVTLFDQLHPLIEMFTHFRLQYFAAGLALLAFLGLFRKPGYFVTVALVSAINGWQLMPWWISDTSTQPSGTEFTIVHANLLFTNDDTAPFLAAMESTDADVIVLQEFTKSWLTVADQLRPRFPHQLTQPREHPFGIALLSRHPISSSKIVDFDSNDSPSLLATINPGSGPTTILATHPPPPISAELIHSRDRQLERIADIASRTNVPLIVIGDLNISMWSHRYRVLEEHGELRNARLGNGIKPTWPRFFPLAAIPIDHCLVSQGIQVVDFETGPDIGSDHLPIIAQLLLPDSSCSRAGTC